jgi:hypothetical protein
MTLCGLRYQVEIACFKVKRNSFLGEVVVQLKPINYQAEVGQKNV